MKTQIASFARNLIFGLSLALAVSACEGGEKGGTDIGNPELGNVDLNLFWQMDDGSETPSVTVDACLSQVAFMIKEGVYDESNFVRFDVKNTLEDIFNPDLPLKWRFQIPVGSYQWVLLIYDPVCQSGGYAMNVENSHGIFQTNHSVWGFKGNFKIASQQNLKLGLDASRILAKLGEIDNSSHMSIRFNGGIDLGQP